MDYPDWIVVDEHGMDVFSPFRVNDEGTAEVVVGLAVITTLDDMQQRVDRIVRVDDVWTCANPRVVWQRDGNGHSDNEEAMNEQPPATVAVFWVVAKDTPMLHCSKRHDTFASAEAEAKRLAAKEHRRFFVLEVVGAAIPQTPPIVWQDAAPIVEQEDGGTNV